MNDPKIHITPEITAGRISEAIETACRLYASHTLYHEALSDDKWSTLSYAGFMDMARDFAQKLAEAGISPPSDTQMPERIALMADNSPRWTAAYTGILLAGAIAVPLDARLTEQEVKTIVQDCDARVMLHSLSTANAALGACNARCINIDEFPWTASHDGASHDEANEIDAGHSVASLLYTSGTTGQPKAVMQTHANVLSDVRDLLSVGIISSRDNVLAVLPFHHTYAFACTFLAPILLGASITLPEGLKGPLIIGAARAKGGTILVGVPQLLDLIRNRAMEKIASRPLPVRAALKGLIAFSALIRDNTGINLMGRINRPLGPQFRFLTSGGARLEPQVMTDLESLGFTVLEGYGLTETSPIVCFNPPQKRKPGSVGLPMPSAQVRILKDRGEDADGEIAIRGPMVTPGYYNREQETRAAFMDGWFLSGDLGHMDRDGYLFITGRKKEMIILSSGKNVYPEEVEQHYLSCPYIREMCAYEDNGSLKAVIVPDYDKLRAASMANATEALRWEIDRLSRALSPHKRVMGYVLRSAPLPRTPLGKLRRFLLKAETGYSKETTQDDQSMNHDETSRRVALAIKKTVPSTSTVRASDNLELDLSIDSLLRVALAARLEAEFSLTIPDSFMAGIHTAGELAEGIQSLMDSGGATDNHKNDEGLDAILSRTPTEEELRRIGYVATPLEMMMSNTGLWAFKLFARAYLRLDVRGLENIPPPPYIIAPNHSSYLDAFVLAAAMPISAFEEMHFIGIEKFFKSWSARHFARIAHVIPIDPDTNLSQALSLSAYCLRSSSPLVVFPEGGCSTNGTLNEFRPGIGILSQKLGVPIVPVHISGTFASMPKWARFPRPGRVSVSFAKPVAPDMAPDRDFQGLADMVRTRVKEMGEA